MTSFNATNPIGGNQDFSHVVHIAPQVANLSVANLAVQEATINAGDILGYTYGANPVRTAVHGYITMPNPEAIPDINGIVLVPALDSVTGEAIIMTPDTEIFNASYICTEGNFYHGTPPVLTQFPIMFGLGDATGPPSTAITSPYVLVQSGTQSIANSLTGGYVQGAFPATGVLNQAFGNNGDGGGTYPTSNSKLIRNVPATPNNSLLVALPADAAGRLDIGVVYTIRRPDLPK